MRRTFLYRLTYEPKSLKHFRVIYDRIDRRRRIGVRIFALRPSAARSKLNTHHSGLEEKQGKP